LNILVSEKIEIQNPTPAIMQYCKNNLTLDNPEFYKKERMGKWTGGTPREIALYEKIGSELWLPFGCIHDVWRLCAGKSVPWGVEFAPIRHLDYNSCINLYSYQEMAVNKAINQKNGILVMPCGSGKTQSGLEIISRIGGRALWLTHTQDLLNQSKARAESVLNCPKGSFGTITAGKVNVGTHITFATVQTMAKLDLSKYRNFWDVIIVDECQHCCGSPTKVTQFYRVISSLSARYKIGLTATPKRADGLEQAMFALLGGIIYEVSREDVAHTTCKIKVLQINTHWQPDFDCVLMGDGTIDYHKVVENMVSDESRYDLVLEQLQKFVEPCMVLANRVEYLQRLCDDYNQNQYGNAICLSGMGQSKAAKEERKKALTALNDGELDCIFATYQLAKEGLDVPNLRWVVLATPEKDETTVIQSVGRVGRKADGKDCGIVIDFVDDFGMYKGWNKKRQGYYRKIGAEVIR